LCVLFPVVTKASGGRISRFHIDVCMGLITVQRYTALPLITRFIINYLFITPLGQHIKHT